MCVYVHIHMYILGAYNLKCKFKHDQLPSGRCCWKPMKNSAFFSPNCHSSSEWGRERTGGRREGHRDWGIAKKLCFCIYNADDLMAWLSSVQLPPQLTHTHTYIYMAYLYTYICTMGDLVVLVGSYHNANALSIIQLIIRGHVKFNKFRAQTELFATVSHSISLSFALPLPLPVCKLEFLMRVGLC